MNEKKLIIVVIGAFFLLLGLCYRIFDPARSNSSYEYIGIGTWSAGMVYYTIYRRYREITSLLLGLMILHAGVILLLVDKISNPQLLGIMVFAAGVVVVLGSGFSDYVRRKKSEKLRQ